MALGMMAVEVGFFGGACTVESEWSEEKNNRNKFIRKGILDYWR